LCSDKTGTLTQNRLAVAARWTAEGISDDELLMAAALASRAEDNDLIDLAIITAAGQRPAMQVEEFIPFDPVSKRTEALVRDSEGQTFRVSKGAPQVIAALCDGDDAATQIDAVVERFATHGHRSLAVARTHGGGAWPLMGVLGLADAPRDDSAATITAAKELGIEVKMVTGDQAAIGREIARQVGLGEQILDAATLDNAAGDHDVGAQVEATDGFAQVFPEHKYRIVRLLQARGHIVGMTGHGVNDALKQADAGIAVAGATDAARAGHDHRQPRCQQDDVGGAIRAALISRMLQTSRLYTNATIATRDVFGHKWPGAMVVTMSVTRFHTPTSWAATRPYNELNWFGGVVGGRINRIASMRRQVDRVTRTILNWYDHADTHAVHRGMTVPSSWDPYLTPWTDRTDLLQMGTQALSPPSRAALVGSARPNGPP